MTGPAGNSEFCFPSTSMFPETKPFLVEMNDEQIDKGRYMTTI